MTDAGQTTLNLVFSEKLSKKLKEHYDHHSEEYLSELAAPAPLDQENEEQPFGVERTMHHFSDSSLNMFRDHAKANFQFWQTARSGVSYKLDFSSNAAPDSSPPKNIKYKLIATEIRPSKSRRLRVSRTPIDPREVDSAPKAEVQWTIKPTQEAPLPKVSSLNDQESKFGSMLPSPVFEAKLSAKDTNGPKSSPPMKIEFYQEDKFYKAELHTNDLFQKDQLFHSTELALGDDSHIGYTWDESFEPHSHTFRNNIQRNGSNIEIKGEHKFAEKKLVGELIYKIDRFNVSFKNENSMPAKINDEKYEIKLDFNF